jgi:hypothetical protein
MMKSPSFLPVIPASKPTPPPSPSRAAAQRQSDNAEQTEAPVSFEEALDQAAPKRKETSSEQNCSSEQQEVAAAAAAAAAVVVPTILIPTDIILPVLDGTDVEGEIESLLDDGETEGANLQLLVQTTVNPETITSTKENEINLKALQAQAEEIAAELTPEEVEVEVEVPTEKVAGSKEEKGKNDSGKQENVSDLRVSVTAPSFSEISKASENKPLSIKELGILDATKNLVQEALSIALPLEPEAILTESSNSKNQDFASMNKPAPEVAVVHAAKAEATDSPEPVRLVSLIERIQHLAESQKPPRPQHLMLQLDPPNLGRVNLDLQWNAKGWTVNWSVTHHEVRDYITQQLPSLQQNNEKVPMVWNLPTLLSSPWDMSRQQQQRAQADKDKNDLLLAEEELENEKEGTKKLAGFWA